ncbi:hypothetical protein QVD17_10470 [Tagetes erecta]|uniref:Uncharacterized protein n=1 Tax=Tagetes erecta TaxID=13708 RepID=A0AAD8L168_TARER|nr:hypothetical protein QVD17_10470 [Tagetes erecta]
MTIINPIEGKKRSQRVKLHYILTPPLFTFLHFVKQQQQQHTHTHNRTQRSRRRNRLLRRRKRHLARL